MMKIVSRVLLLALFYDMVNGAITDFRVGIQMCDHEPGENKGAVRYTPYASKNGGWSKWAGDSNYYDPDGMRIGLFARTGKGIKKIKNTDIRLCIQLTDHAKNSRGNKKKQGRAECTEWASSGGGWSKFAGDSNFYDYDAVRVKLESKKKKGFDIDNIRVGVRMTDDKKNKNKVGKREYTEWFGQSSTTLSTWSEWAGDSNFYDADSIQIFLGVRKGKGSAAEISDINIDGYDNNNDGGFEFVMNRNVFMTVVGIICVLLIINMICCCIQYYHKDNNKKKAYKVVSVNSDTDV